jgi:hypothetical protein
MAKAKHTPCENCPPGKAARAVHNVRFANFCGGRQVAHCAHPRGSAIARLHEPAIWPLWDMFDFTPDGRGATWQPKLNYG